MSIKRKNKKRQSKKTRLLYCEGPHEETFLKHLYKLFSNPNTSVKIKAGKGGSADQLVVDTINTFGDFNIRVIIIDNDKPKKEMEKARSLALSNGVLLIEHVPCLEAVLLAVLIKDKEFDNKTSNWCKEKFQSDFIKGKDRTDIKHYSKVFTKELLESRSKRVKALSNMIDLIKKKELDNFS